jgi:putative transcriptional regulator
MPMHKPKPADKVPTPKRHEPDWAALEALTDEEIDAQIAADPDAAPELTEEWFEKAEKLEPIDIKAIRATLGMSQAEFARAFSLDPAALRDWEQRGAVPRGPALALLRIIEREPEAVRRALVSDTRSDARTEAGAVG